MALADEIAVRASQRSLVGFHEHLVIDSVPPRRFAEVGEHWQRERVLDYAPAFHLVSGLESGYTGPRWFWDGKPRGHDKTGQIARLLLWVAGFSRRKLSASVVAGDWDQVQLDRTAMLRTAELNPWLMDRLDFDTKKVTGPGGVVKFLTADGKSNFGAFDDIYVCDEVTTWEHEKGKKVWDAIVSGIEKRRLSLLVVLTNAGYLRTWQHVVRLESLRSGFWRFRESGPGVHLAGWMDRVRIAEMRKLLTPAEARRVIDNIWIDASEEVGYLTRDEVLRCVLLGRERRAHFRLTGEPGVRYFTSVDYGPKNDRTALCVLHREPDTGVVVLDRMEVWQGSRDNPVRVEAVEQWADEMVVAFHNPVEVYDPYQMLGTIQKRSRTHEVVAFESQGGKKNYEMAENLRSLAVNNQLALYEGAGRVDVDGVPEDLVEEMCGLITRRMPYGYRFDHELNSHDDRTVALGMGALEAVKQQSPEWVHPRGEVVSVESAWEPRPRFDGGSRRGLWGM